jgi:hypothetical protein
MFVHFNAFIATSTDLLMNENKIFRYLHKKCMLLASILSRGAA